MRSFTLHLKSKHAPKLTPEQEENLDAAAAAGPRPRRQDHGSSRARISSGGICATRRPTTFRASAPSPTDDFADTADGPTVLPGAYTVALQYGSTTLRAPLTVRLDPRLHPAAGRPGGAARARKADPRQSIDRLDRAIAAAMDASAKLPPAKRAAANDARLRRWCMLDIHSSEADVMHDTKIREQLAFLLNSLEGAYARPTAAEYATYKDLDALATAGEARLKSSTAQPAPGITVRVRRCVAALQADLVRAMLRVELDEELRIEGHRAVGCDVELDHPALDAVGIELIVPRAVERVREVDAPPVAADLDHLRAAVERRRRIRRMRRAPHDAADVDRADELRMERIAHVVLAHLAGAPARRVEVAVVEREIDVAQQRRHGREALEQIGQLRRDRPAPPESR